ncbi:MAG: chitobiase/beta-hexosaminidase C-terminal domain-containing protein, partial [Clostridia bacterium]
MNVLFGKSGIGAKILVALLLVISSMNLNFFVSRVSASTWTAVSLGFGTTNINKIAYNNGTWLMFNSFGDYGTSSNGTSWTKAPTPLGAAVNQALHVQSKWVAVGYAGSTGKIFTLNDGLDPLNNSNWIERTVPKTNKLVSIASDGTNIVAVGDTGGTIYRSVDGVIWTDSSVPEASGFNAVTYGACKFWAVGKNTDGSFVIYSSVDGQAWTKVNTATPSTQLYGVAYGNGMLVAAGLSGYLYVSADGNTWVEKTSPTGPQSFAAVTYGDGYFYVGGTNETLITSPDGSTWATEITAGSTKTIQSIAVGNGKVIVAGGSGLAKIGDALVASVQKPTASPAGGEVAAGTTVTLSSGTAGATIHYTTDGSTPTTS